MALYEHIFIARQDLSNSQVEGLTTEFSKIITDNGGTIAKTEPWGLRTMAYEIKKNKKGHYVLLQIDAPSDAVKEMERIMKLNSDVLRHLTLKVDAFDAEPSALLKDRDDGGYQNKKFARR